MAKYADLATLANDPKTLDAIAQAVVKYAMWIMGEASNTALHNTRIMWAKQAMMAPRGTAQQIVYRVTQDPVFTGQADGAVSLLNIDDAKLQSAVENAINTAIFPN